MDPGEMTGSGSSQASGSGTSDQAKVEKDGGDDMAGRHCNTSKISGPHVGDGNSSSSTMENSLPDHEDALKHPFKHQREELHTKNNLSTSDTVLAPISQRVNISFDDKVQEVRNLFEHGANEVNDQESSSAPGERPADCENSLDEPRQVQNPLKHGESEVDDQQISSASGQKPADEYSLDEPKQDPNPFQQGENEVDSSAAPVVISSENIGEKREDNYSYVDELAEEDHPFQHKEQEL